MKEEFTINSFTGRNKAVEILQKVGELEDLLIKFGVYDTDNISLKGLEDELRGELLKFEKGKL